MKPKNNVGMFEMLKTLSSEQRAAARNPNHPINDRLRKSLKEDDEQLRMIKFVHTLFPDYKFLI